MGDHAGTHRCICACRASGCPPGFQRCRCASVLHPARPAPHGCRACGGRISGNSSRRRRVPGTSRTGVRAGASRGDFIEIDDGLAARDDRRRQEAWRGRARHGVCGAACRFDVACRLCGGANGCSAVRCAALQRDHRAAAPGRYPDRHHPDDVYRARHSGRQHRCHGSDSSGGQCARRSRRDTARRGRDSGHVPNDGQRDRWHRRRRNRRSTRNARGRAVSWGRSKRAAEVAICADALRSHFHCTTRVKKETDSKLTRRSGKVVACHMN